MMRIVGATGVILAAALAAGCGDGKAANEADKVNGKGSGGGGAASKAGKGGGGKQLSSAEAAARFTAWTPIPAFLSAPVIGGAVVGDKGAIVFTKDNHVGVTTDGGVSWGFVKMTTGTVKAAAGAPGGPYIVTGAGGFVSVSADGRIWTDLPRESNEDLVGVAVGDLGIAAVGAKGAFLRMDKKGASPTLTQLDGFKAQGVVVDAARYVVFAGKKAQESTDGIAWTPVDYVAAGAGSAAPTSRGLCSIGNVGKKKGVVCKVAGTAYGLDGGAVLVVDKAWVALTRDAGSSWSLAPLPSRGSRAWPAAPARCTCSTPRGPSRPPPTGAPGPPARTRR